MLVFGRGLDVDTLRTRSALLQSMYSVESCASQNFLSSASVLNAGIDLTLPISFSLFGHDDLDVFPARGVAETFIEGCQHQTVILRNREVNRIGRG
jgi:hypothetical protein